MLSGPNTEVAFSFSLTSNAAITTQKFVNKLGTKSFGKAVLKSKYVV